MSILKSDLKNFELSLDVGVRRNSFGENVVYLKRTGRLLNHALTCQQNVHIEQEREMDIYVERGLHECEGNLK